MTQDKSLESSLAGKYILKPIGELTPNPANARTHPKAQIKKIAASIKKFGFINPVLIDQNGMIMAGHGRIEAAKTMSIAEVPCLIFEHLTEAQRRAYTLMDNRSAEDSGWDQDLLAQEMKWLNDQSFDLDMTGFETSEVGDFLTSGQDRSGENDVPDVPVNPVSQLGETWLLGKHRVRCGSSTNPEDVKALLGDRVPHLMVTDPPYGVEYDAQWRTKVMNADGKHATVRATGKVMNDDKADWTEAWKLFPGEVAYVWHADRFSHVVALSLENSDFNLRNLIIWNKSSIAIGRGDYHHKHEPCWYAVRKKGTGHWNGSRKENTVWDIDKPQKSETGHSTQKPVECMRRPIVNNSKNGDEVYDPFLGSGTTLIAAQSEGRICYGQELNPAYVDVIIRRWQEQTGEKAFREGDGVKFDDLKPVKTKAA